MEIKDLLQNYSLRKKGNVPKTERAELLNKFVDRLNADRVSSGRKPLKAGVYAIKMAQGKIRSISDLYWFYAYCDEAKNFSACWWWALSSKNIKK